MYDKDNNAFTGKIASFPVRCRTHSIAGTSRSGFALVLSLVLMAFILLLMVSFSIFITVEVQASRTNNLQQQARQNALLALNMALAELQRVAGPDQRVTARADILDSRTDVQDENSTVANPYYTGVWDVSWPSGSEPTNWPIVPGTLPLHNRDLKPYFLVSGNEGHEFSSSSAQINEGTTNFNNPISFPEIDVTVEGVGILDSDGQRVGTYAWWVGDEGVKAKITLRNPQEVLARPNPALFSPGGNPALLHSSLSGFDFLAAADDLANAYHPGDLLNVDAGFSILFGSSGNSQRFESFHDISLHSMGVLADVRNGGLKKDLSPTFGLGADIPDEVADSVTLFPLNPTGTADPDFILFNPSFGQLRSYYRAGNLLENPPSGIEVITGPNAWENNPVATYRMGSNTVSGVAPVVIRAQNSVTPFAIRDFTELDSDAKPLLRLYYAFQPIIVLWNPYDTAITTPNMLALDWSVAGSVGYADDPLNGISHRFRLYNELKLPEGAKGSGGESSFFDLRLPQFAFELPEVVIPAGRAIVFSPPPYTASQGDYHVQSNRIPLEPKYNPDGFFVHVATHMPGVGANGDPLDQPDTHDEVAFWWDQINPLEYSWGTNSPGGSQGNKYRIHGFFNGSGQMWDFIGVNIENDGSINPWYKPEEALFRSMQLSEFVGTMGSVNPDPISNLDIYDDLDQLEVDGIDLLYLRYVIMKFPGSINFGQSANNDAIKWLLDFNPRAEWSSAFRQHSSTLKLPGMYYSGYVGEANIGQSEYTLLFADDDDGKYIFVSPWRAGTDVGPGRAVIHSVRRDDRPLWNIAELTHANLLGGEKRSSGGINPRGGYNRAPAFPLGNSYVPTVLEYDMTMLPDGYYESAPQYWQRTYFYDHSYLMNEGLYDRYFLSGVSSPGNLVQLNPKLVFTADDSTQNAGDFISFDDTAAYFMMDGAFNVNSTSKDAWKLFLGGLRDSTVELRDGVVDGGTGSGTSVVQLPNPVRPGLDANSLDKSEPVTPVLVSDGYRRMSDAELDVLAEQIVLQVKLRGPFPSMSAFVNRILADPDSSWSTMMKPVYRDELSFNDRLELVESGALQAALDASVNAVLFDNDDLRATYNSMAPGKGAKHSLHGSITEGLSAFVMQSNLLARMDSMMNVRSDTFTIVAYGDVVDPLTAKTVATAKCEAVVQRIPDYVVPKFPDDNNDGDLPSANPYDSSGKPALTSSLNREMGRRFVVISFRWL